MLAHQALRGHILQRRILSDGICLSSRGVASPVYGGGRFGGGTDGGALFCSFSQPAYYPYEAGAPGKGQGDIRWLAVSDGSLSSSADSRPGSPASGRLTSGSKS